MHEHEGATDGDDADERREKMQDHHKRSRVFFLRVGCVRMHASCACFRQQRFASHGSSYRSAVRA